MTPEASRQSVVRNCTQEWLPLILHFSFTTGSSFLFAPHQKLRYSLLSFGPLTCSARKSPAWIILMVNPPAWGESPLPLPFFDLCIIFLFQKNHTGKHTQLLSHTWDFTVAFLELRCVLHVSRSRLRVPQRPVDTSRQNFTKCSRKR